MRRNRKQGYNPQILKATQQTPKNLTSVTTSVLGKASECTRILTGAAHQKQPWSLGGSSSNTGCEMPSAANFSRASFATRAEAWLKEAPST